MPPERVIKEEYLAKAYAVRLNPSERTRARSALGYLGRQALVGAAGAAVMLGVWWGVMQGVQGYINSHESLREYLPRIEANEK